MTDVKKSVPMSLLILLIAMVSIQSGASFAKELFPVLGAAGVSFLRVGFSALILLAFWRPWRWKLSKNDLKQITAFGVCLGAMNLLFYLALERLPLGLTVTLEFIGPLAVALFSSKKLLDLAWAILAFIGIILMFPHESTGASLDLIGVAFALAAGVAWGLYIIIGKKASSNIHPGAITSIGMVASFLVIAPFGVAQAGAELLNPKYIPMGILVAVLSSALPYSLEMIALRNIPKKTFSVLMSLEPAISAMAGFIILREYLTGYQWLAIVCVIMASMGSTTTAKKTE